MPSKTYTVVFFRDAKTGKEPAKEWLDGLRDRQTKARIDIRIRRAETGNFGDHKSVGEGVWELKIQFGSGYRVYYAIEKEQIILLLYGGDKSSQERDIAQAKKYWAQHKKKEKNG